MNTKFSSRFWQGSAALALLCSLTGAACGTRVDKASSAGTAPAALDARLSAGSPPPVALADTGLRTATPTDGPTVQTGPAPVSGASRGTVTQAPAPPTVLPGASPRPSATPAPAATGGGSAAPPSGAPAAPGGGGGPAAGVGPAGPEDHSEIVIGSLGTQSGPAGSAIKQTSEGAALWAAWVNAHGGVAGHPVRLIVADDGGDPARYRALLQRLVERDNVVAMVANPDGITGASGVSYVTSKSVPYIGGDGGGDWYYSSPMYFPQGTIGHTFLEAETFDIGDYARTKGKKKFASITCVEGDICRTAHRIFAERAADAGLDLVYQAQSSLTQPDFTAECLSAQRAGAEMLEVILDPNSIRRVSASCARQGYHPLLGWIGGIAQDDQAGEPTFDGARITLFTFSWTDRSTPAAVEFQEAMARLGKGFKPLTAGHTGGWTAAKLFERAISVGSGKVSRERVLAGLWTLKNETLGGITAPLTFTKAQNAPRTRCWTSAVINNGKWTSLRDGKFICH